MAHRIVIPTNLPARVRLLKAQPITTKEIDPWQEEPSWGPL
jgi:hypothetical protein